MSYSPVGDTVAVINITWQIYNKIYVVARDAPKEYSSLLADLRVFSDQVKLIRARYEGSKDAPTDSLRTELKRSSQTLVDFKEKLAKYSDLGRSERESRLRRMQWVKEQATINDFRDKLAKHKTDIHFALSVTELSTEAKKDRRIVDDAGSGITESRGFDLCRACSSYPLPRVTTADSTAHLHSPRGSLVSSPTLVCTCSRTLPPNSSPNLRKRTLDFDRRASTISNSSTNCPSCNESIINLQPMNHDSSALGLDFGPEFQLETTRRASTRPLAPESDRHKHNAAPKVQANFRHDYLSKKDQISRDTWLSFAAWWLMKSRILFEVLQTEKDSIQASESKWTTTTSLQQCHADLLKSSWIFEEIIMTGDVDSFDAQQYRTISHLARTLDEDLQKFHDDLHIFRDDGLAESVTNQFRLNFNLTETFEQTIEEQAMNDPSPAHRWIDVDQDDRGARHEKVLFQTFVNAQLGDKNQRDKSHDAPYTLLLWTMQGEAGLFVSLCNQSGTVNLARSMVVEDLKDFERGRPQTTLLLQFDFPNQESEIRFINESDVHAFFKIPKRIFEETSDKRPRPGELAIFQNPIKSCVDRSLPSPYREQQDKTLKSGKYSSCGLHLYESTDEQCWKTTRRLVISSTPEDDFDIECLSYWLPFDQIQLTVHDREVMMAWSDCGQLMSKSEGSWDDKYYFIYNAAKPNRKLILEFESVFDANTFEECLLFPTEIPPYAAELPPQVKLMFKIERPSVYQDLRIYRLLDQDDLDNKYHAIVEASKNPSNFHISHIYYVYRDIDWIVTNVNYLDPSKVEFLDLISPGYESNMRRLPYPPRYTITDKTISEQEQDPIPSFKDVIESPRDAMLPLGCKHNISRFMHALIDWQLIYHHICPKLTLPGSEKHKNVAIQLWAKYPNSESETTDIRLAVRLPEPARSNTAFKKRRWLTADLSMQHTSKKDELELKEATVWRGSHVDIVEMVAVAQGNKRGNTTPEKKRCKITVAFGDGGEKQEFVQLVFGRR